MNYLELASRSLAGIPDVGSSLRYHSQTFQWITKSRSHTSEYKVTLVNKKQWKRASKMELKNASFHIVHERKLGSPSA